MRISSYALQYGNVSYPAIAASTLDLFITEGAPLAATEAARALTDAQVAALRAQGRIVIGYVNVAVTDDARYYWEPRWTNNGKDTGALTSNAPAWLQAGIPLNFDGVAGDDAYIVKFDDPLWQQYVIDQAVELVRRGYSGIFLDDVAAYFALGYFYDGVTGVREHATLMAEFVGRIASAVRMIDPNAYIVANADPYFVNNQMENQRGTNAKATYLAAVDAHLFENKTAFDLDTGLPSFAGETILLLESDGSHAYPEARARMVGTLYVAPSDYNSLGSFTYPATVGDDVRYGGNGPNQFDFSAGGNDFADGGPGDDSFYFGTQLTSADRIIGGLGTNDQVGILGNYTGSNRLLLGAGTLAGVEVLAVLPGGSYDITLDNGTVPAGSLFTVFGGNLGATDNLTVNGAAVLSGSVVVYSGLGTDLLTGGSGNDGFYFGPGKYGPADRVTGGPGNNDQLALDGSYTLTLTSREDVEVFVMLAGPAATPNNFNITVADSWVAVGTQRTIFGTSVTTNIIVNASAELDGNLRFFSGTGNDILTGGAGNDNIWGNRGGDTLSGGSGNDIFRYDDVIESFGSGTNRDRILDFRLGDLIDLSRIDAIVSGGDNAFSFIGSSAFGNVAGQLRAVNIGSNIYAVDGDINGDGIADFSLWLTSADAHVITAADFVL